MTEQNQFDFLFDEDIDLNKIPGMDTAMEEADVPDITINPTENGLEGTFNTGTIDTVEYGQYSAKGTYQVNQEELNVDGTIDAGYEGIHIASVDTDIHMDKEGNKTIKFDNLEVMGKEVYSAEDGFNLGAISSGLSEGIPSLDLPDQNNSELEESDDGPKEKIDKMLENDEFEL